MKKLITLLAILLFATNLYSSDWKLIESFPYDYKSDYTKVNDLENHSIIGNENGYCMVISTANNSIWTIESPKFSLIRFSSNYGITWESNEHFDGGNSKFIFPSFAFFESELLFWPIGRSAYVGKVQEISKCYSIWFYGIAICNNKGEINSISYFKHLNDLLSFLMYNEKIGFGIGTHYKDRNQYIIEFTKDNWLTTDSILLSKDIAYFANYRDSENIVISSLRESEDNPTEYFLQNLEISNKEITEIFATTEFKPDDLFFLNSETGFATNSTSEDDKAVIYKTNDGGKSWSTVYDSAVLTFYYKDCDSRIRFEFYDENNGIIPYLGGILMTRDGGETWTASPIETEVSTRNITATWVGSSIIADGRDRKLYRYQGDFFDIPLGTAEPALPVCNTFDNKLPVKLEWIPAGMATHYRLQVSKFEDFSEIELFEDSINNNYFAIAELDSGVKYFWRVQPYNSKEEGVWSESCSFTVVYPSSVIDGDSRFSIYPNPTRDILHIRTDELISRVELSDVLGNVVISDLTPTLSKGEGVSLNVENLPAGMYFLKLYTMSGEVLVEKVIVGF